MSFVDEIESIRKILLEEGGNLTQSLVSLLKVLEKEYDNLETHEQRHFCDMFDDLMNGYGIGLRLFLLTFLSSVTKECRYLQRAQEIVLNDKNLLVENKYYLNQRFDRIAFLNQGMEEHDIIVNRWKILRDVVETYASVLERNHHLDFHFIPGKDRRKGFVIVVIGQFLSAGHAPSAIALDRCRILQKRLNKSVLMINVADVLTQVGAIPTWNDVSGNYISQYSSGDYIDWNGSRIPFFQCDQSMPNPEVTNMLLTMIQNQKPEYIIDIGNCGLFAGLAAKIVPVLTLYTGTSFSGSETQYKAFPRPLGEGDRQILREMEVAEDRFIPSLFTFSFSQEKGEPITREALGLSESDHVVVVVGNRLDQELTPELWQILCTTGDSALKVVLIGDYREDKVSGIITEYPEMKGRILLCGFVSELRSYYRISDLYINPVRRGGGTSAVMALSVGLPVLTLRSGDVYYNVGDDFAVDTLEEMSVMMRRYFADPAFRIGQSKKGIARARRLQDSEWEFCKLIHTFENKIV
ncbi:MAG: glycosyltransferase [Lachnospiraceae bacterium]|nr:glycosyltransferase [Lachnospiraceae bacterium]